MKISFNEILHPGVLLYVGTQNSSFSFDFGGVLDQNVLFSTIDLENNCQGQIFPRPQYEKGVLGEKLKSLSYHTLKSDVRFGL
jgi:hypothetical protein